MKTGMRIGRELHEVMTGPAQADLVAGKSVEFCLRRRPPLQGTILSVQQNGNGRVEVLAMAKENGRDWNIRAIHNPRRRQSWGWLSLK